MERISREGLLEKLALVSPGRSKKNFIEQSACFVFKDGQLVTFNDEVCCRTKSELSKTLEAAVPGKQLEDVLKNMTDEDVEVEAVGSELRIRGRRKKVVIRLEGDIRLPVDAVAPPAEWFEIENPELFGRAVKQVCATAGTDQEEFRSLCVNVAPGFLESTDRYQATRYDIPTGVPARFLVRAKSLQHIHQLGVTRVGLTDSWVHYRNRALIVSIRRQTDDFYDLSGFFDFKGAPLELPRGADEAAKLGKVFSQDDKDNPKVLVSLSDGRLAVRGEGAYGWAEADLECTYRGAPVSFRIKPETLETLVTDHQRCEVTEKKLLVRGDRWLYLSVLGAPKHKTEAKVEKEVHDYAEDPEHAEEPY